MAEPQQSLSWFSLAGKFALIVILASAVGAAAGVALYGRLEAWGLAFVLALLCGLLAGLLLTQLFVKPVTSVLLALEDGLRNLSDHDYSSGIAVQRTDELGQLAIAYNKLSTTLRAERLSLHQRELLLDTVIQSADLAVVLTNDNAVIIYDNPVARRLLMAGQPLVGRSLDDIARSTNETLVDVILNRRQGLFTMSWEGESETYHLGYRTFKVNNQRNHLYLLKQLTHELSREELATWKRLIRIISHELNNSLAPILSLSHSARELAKRPDGAQRLRDVLDTVAARASHLREFIEGYVRFARLPRPRCRRVEWPAYLQGLESLNAFKLVGEVPQQAGYFDPVQIEQVLINLIRNAHESSVERVEVTLEVKCADTATLILVGDRGGGMDEETLSKALLPFYSTKAEGSGLGLALCREILEGHGGRLRLMNRARGGVMAICELPVNPADQAS